MLTPRFLRLSPTTLADVLSRDRVVDFEIRAVWPQPPRVAGPAYPVRCFAEDSLSLHAAIYRAPKGSVLVVQAGDRRFAVAGGNVCAIAQRRGIAGLVVDGLIRDVAEVRARTFPVFARGVIPIAAGKAAVDVIDGPVVCGGVRVSPGDMLVADEEGIVVIPDATAEEVLAKAEAKAAAEVAKTLEQWEASHRARTAEQLQKLGLPHDL